MTDATWFAVRTRSCQLYTTNITSFTSIKLLHSHRQLFPLKYMIDHHSYTHNLSTCKIKA